MGILDKISKENPRLGSNCDEKVRAFWTGQMCLLSIPMEFPLSHHILQKSFFLNLKEIRLPDQCYFSRENIQPSMVK